MVDVNNPRKVINARDVIFIENQFGREKKQFESKQIIDQNAIEFTQEIPWNDDSNIRNEKILLEGGEEDETPVTSLLGNSTYFEIRKVKEEGILMGKYKICTRRRDIGSIGTEEVRGNDKQIC